MAVRAVLWDADGVLQGLPPFEDLWDFLADDVREQVVAELFGDMPDVLSGAVDMAARVEDVVVRHRIGEHADAFRATWDYFPPVADARRLLADVRRSGITCVLATNQDSLRERHMRPVYEPLLDRLYFSSALGVAKPDAAFFGAIAADLGLAPDALLFVDDSAANVEGARATGLHAEQWHHDDGITVLEGLLERHGVGQAAGSSRRA